MRPQFLRRLLSLFTLCAILFPSVASADDWPQYRGPSLTGISTETDWSHDWGDAGPKRLWKQNVGVGLSGIVISDGRAYTIGNADDIDTVFCFDAATGKPIWKHDYEAATDPNEFDGGPTSTPTVNADHVFTISRGGEVYCFGKATGEVIWRVSAVELADVRTPGWGFAGSPLVIGDLLLLNVGDTGMALKKATGALAWSSGDKDAGYSSMVPTKVGGTNAVVFGSSRSYVCVDTQAGKLIWRQRWLTTFGCNAADPILSGDNIFISSGYNRGSALLKHAADAPEVIWKNKDLQSQISSPVLIDGFLYGIHGDIDVGAELRCLELATGEVCWSGPKFKGGGLSAAGKRLVVLTGDGELLIVKANPKQSEILARHQVIQGKCWTPPVLSGGRIYCRSTDGEIVCLK